MIHGSMTTLRTLTCWLKQNRNNSAHAAPQGRCLQLYIFSLQITSVYCIAFPVCVCRNLAKSQQVRPWARSTCLSKGAQCCKDVMTCYRQGRELLVTVQWLLKSERHSFDPWKQGQHVHSQPIWMLSHSVSTVFRMKLRYVCAYTRLSHEKCDCDWWAYLRGLLRWLMIWSSYVMWVCESLWLLLSLVKVLDELIKSYHWSLQFLSLLLSV